MQRTGRKSATRVAIVDDDVLLREQLVCLISGEPNFRVCGAFSSAEEALPCLLLNKPDVLLAALGLPGLSGIEMIRKLKSTHPDVDIMVHTEFADRQTVFAAIKAGAAAYILKGVTPREIIESIHALSQGGSPLSPQIARAVVTQLQDVAMGDPYLLSPREREVLIGLEQGLSYKELADTLSLSPHTIHTHIKKIYKKLRAGNRREALLSARMNNIL